MQALRNDVLSLVMDACCILIATLEALFRHSRDVFRPRCKSLPVFSEHPSSFLHWRATAP